MTTYDRDTVKALLAAAFKAGILAGRGQSVNVHHTRLDTALLLEEAMRSALADSSVFPRVKTIEKQHPIGAARGN